MRTRARLLSGARWSLVLVAVGAILLIGFLPAHAQGDEEGTVSTPASQAPYLPLQVQPVNVNITQINPSKFPIIELYVLVTDQDGNTIPGLSASNFRATEQSNLESQPTPETISVASVTITGNIAVALAIDRSGSMSGSKIADAKTAANTFIDNLAVLDRAAVISFSSSVTVNQTFTSDKTALHSAVNSLSAGGNTAVYDAIYKAVEEATGEIGVKAVIIFTDGRSNSGSHTVQEAIDLAKNRGIPVYTIGLGSDVNTSILQTIAVQTGGYYTFAPTAADLQQIYNDIAQAIRDQYLVTYSTHNPNYDGTTRTVEVTVTVGANSDSDTETYTVTEPPEINLTQDTLNLMAQAQYAGQTLTIGAIITDDVAVTQAKVFYRTSGSGDIYKEVSMTSSSNLYTADIPGSDVATPGVDFYITASDGTLTSSEPQNNPATYPHQISILPNEAPVIDHTPVTTATVGTNVVISAHVTDTTDYVDHVKLFYRTTGYVLYGSADMVSSSATYVGTIPGSKVTVAGVDYYIVASDNHTVRTHDGTDVAPHHIDVTSGPINQPPNTKIETADIDASKGTAKFTWSGSDDTTPPAQLVYKHRLLNPDSPLYGWSDWSSSTTATYPRSPDSRLPGGTYRFQVKAKDADEAIQPDSATWKFTIGLEDHPPTTSASDLSSQPTTMHPNTAYSVSAKYYDPDGRDDLKYCYLRLNHPTKPLTMMWYQADGHAAPWAGEEGENYLTITDVVVTEIVDGTEGYELTWKFKINDQWPEVEEAIDFGVFAMDDGDLESGWDYDDTKASFTTDTTTPALIQDFTASDGENGQSTLTWTNPPDSDLDQVIVKRKTTGYPTSHTDGEARLTIDGAIPGKAETLVDTGLNNGTTYYYAVFSRDSAGNWNDNWQEGKNADTGTPQADFTFVHITDPHVGWTGLFGDRPRSAAARLANALAEIRGRVPEAAFILVTGDIAEYGYVLVRDQYGTVLLRHDPGFFATFSNIMAQSRQPDAPFPYFSVPGNHDRYPDVYLLERDTTLGLSNYYTWVFPVGIASVDDFHWIVERTGTKKDHAAYSFEYGGLLFVGLDSGKDKGVNHRKSTGLTAAQWNALRELDEETPKIVFMHHPAVYDDEEGVYGITGFREEFVDGIAETGTPAYCDEYNVQLVLTGHKHEDQIYERFGADGRIIQHVTTPSVTKKNNRGFRVIDVVGGLIALRDTVSTVQPRNHQSIQLILPGFFGPFIIEPEPVPAGVVGPAAASNARFVSLPTALHIYDSQGRHVGIDDQGYRDLDIPSAFHFFDFTVDSDEAPETVLLFDTSEAYTYVVKGAEERTYGLELENVTEVGVAAMFTATGIPVADSSAHRYTIDWDALALGEKGVTVQIDQDGDGVFERTITADDELTSEEFSGVPTGKVVNNGPNPVPDTGTAFFYTLPEGTSAAKLMIFNITGRLLFETPIDVDSSRFPGAGTWSPVDQDGIPLANGPYVYVLIADGKVIGQGKMVIQR